jgi:hypothetical protein
MSPPPFARVALKQPYHGARTLGVLSVTRVQSRVPLSRRPASGGGSLAIVTMGRRLPSAAP